MYKQCPEQDEWTCPNPECGTTVVAVDATRVFCPGCGNDMVKQFEEPANV